jgi:tetratricopeptide (TPR) repeat protein
MRQSQAAFEKVEQAGSPTLTDASMCAQAQAAALAVALPQEQTPLHFQRGYCELASAAITRSAKDFTDAAEELEKGNAPALVWLARLQTGDAGAPPDLQSLAANHSGACSSCAALYDTGRLWQGYFAWKKGDLDAAARYFDGLTESGWPSWIAGTQAFRAGKYGEALTRFRWTADTWAHGRHDKAPSLAARLAPPTDLQGALTELGGTQLLAGDTATAIATLGEALQAGSPDARAFYIRGRAKELRGDGEGSLADYNLASRTAFANAKDLATGEAHLYRGILLYRRKDFPRAEDEFASALNLAIPSVFESDVSAWRHLAAVSSGYCGASREYLEKSLNNVSPFFPKDEALAVAAGCLSSRGGL